MNDNHIFEQFTMFNFKPITNNVLYWENALSYSNELSKFIELVDKEEKSYSRISKWENNSKKVITNKMNDSTGIDLLDKRTLYISNSFAMAFEMCFERYFQSKNVDPKEYYLDLNSFVIKKISQDSLLLSDYEIKDKVAFCLIAYINDTYIGGNITLLNSPISFKPKAGSVLIIPIEELNNYKVDDVVGTKYVCSAVLYKNRLEA